MARTGRPRKPSTSAIAEIRRLHSQGMSVREIARRSGLGKTSVHNVIRGKHSLSQVRASAVEERLRSTGYTLVLIRGEPGPRWVQELTQRDRSRIGKHWNVIGRALRRHDYELVRRELSTASLTIKTTDGILILDDQPDALRDFDDAGILTPQEIFVGGSA
jgi:transcriptional regulator with XRE-family HTH domain